MRSNARTCHGSDKSGERMSREKDRVRAWRSQDAPGVVGLMVDTAPGWLKEAMVQEMRKRGL